MPPRPVLVPDLANRAAAMRALRLRTDRRSAILCPGAEYGPAKRWPPTHFAELAALFLADGLQVWLVGSPNDRLAAESVLQAAGRIRAPDARPDRAHRPRHRDRPAVARLARRQQRFGPDARGGGRRRAAGRAVRIVVARVHAAAVAAAQVAGSTSRAAPASSASARSGTSGACAISRRVRVYDLAQLVLLFGARRRPACVRSLIAPRDRHGQGPHAADLHDAGGRRARVLSGVRGARHRRDDGDVGRGRGHRLRPSRRRADGRLRRGAHRLGAAVLGRHAALVPARSDRRDRDGGTRDAERRRAHHARQRRQPARRGHLHQRLPAHAVGLAHGVHHASPAPAVPTAAPTGPLH